MGDAVLEAFTTTGPAARGKKLEVVETLPKVIKIAVKGMPGSGTPEELMDAAGISAPHIVTTVKALV
jgi:transketolase